MRSSTWNLLEDNHIAYTIVDEPLLPPEVHVTADIAYMRWHGRGRRPWYNYRYEEEELKPWTSKIEEAAKGSKQVYGYFNNHFHGYAVENCLQILEMIGKITPEQTKAKQWIEDYRKSTPMDKAQQFLSAFSEVEVEKASIEDLLSSFIDKNRLRRAHKIKGTELTIQKSTHEHIKATIKDYSIEVNFEKKEILHDCADWSRQSTTKQFCKHLAKLFLLLPETESWKRLSKIVAELDSWTFRQF